MKKREIPLFEYDDEVPAVIEPSQLLDPIDVAKHCVLCFFQDVINAYNEAGQLKQIYHLGSERGLNPLYEMENQVTAIQSFLPDTPVRSVLFFDHNARFPKGHPDQVLNPDNIPDYMLRVTCPEPRVEVLDSWAYLLKIAKQVNQSVILQK